MTRFPQSVVNRMTNWQRNQWARAGYPADPAVIARFTRLQRDGSEVYTGSVVAPDVGLCDPPAITRNNHRSVGSDVGAVFEMLGPILETLTRHQELLR